MNTSQPLTYTDNPMFAKAPAQAPAQALAPAPVPIDFSLLYQPFWQVLIDKNTAIKIINDKKQAPINLEDEKIKDGATLDMATDSIKKTTADEKSSLVKVLDISKKTMNVIEENPDIISSAISSTTSGDAYSETQEQKDDTNENIISKKVMEEIEEEKEEKEDNKQQGNKQEDATEESPLLQDESSMESLSDSQKQTEKESLKSQLNALYARCKGIQISEQNSNASIEKISKFDYYEDIFGEKLPDYFNFELENGDKKIKCFIFYKSTTLGKQYYLLSNQEFTYNAVKSTSLFSVGFLAKTILDNKDKPNTKKRDDPLTGEDLIMKTILDCEQLLRGDKNSYKSVIKGPIDERILSKYIYSCFETTEKSLAYCAAVFLLAGSKPGENTAKIKDLFSYLIITKLFWRGFNKRPFKGRINTRYSISSGLYNSVEKNTQQANIDYENAIEELRVETKERAAKREERRIIEEEQKKEEDKEKLRMQLELDKYKTIRDDNIYIMTNKLEDEKRKLSKQESIYKKIKQQIVDQGTITEGGVLKTLTREQAVEKIYTLNNQLSEISKKIMQLVIEILQIDISRSGTYLEFVKTVFQNQKLQIDKYGYTNEYDYRDVPPEQNNYTDFNVYYETDKEKKDKIEHSKNDIQNHENFVTEYKTKLDNALKTSTQLNSLPVIDKDTILQDLCYYKTTKFIPDVDVEIIKAFINGQSSEQSTSLVQSGGKNKKESSVLKSDKNLLFFELPFLYSTEVLWSSRNGFMSLAVFGFSKIDIGKTKMHVGPMGLFKHSIKKLNLFLDNIELSRSNNTFGYLRNYLVLYPACVVAIIILQIIRMIDIVQIGTFFTDMKHLNKETLGTIYNHDINIFEQFGLIIAYIICRVVVRVSETYLFGSLQIVESLVRRLVSFLYNGVFSAALDFHTHRQEHFNDVNTIMYGGGRSNIKKRTRINIGRV
jgi:hypothetical protein